MIEGEKKKDKDPEKIGDNIFNTRDFGKFNVEIQFKTEDYKIVPKSKKYEFQKGILLLKYNIDNGENEKEEKKDLKIEDAM